MHWYVFSLSVLFWWHLSRDDNSKYSSGIRSSVNIQFFLNRTADLSRPNSTAGWLNPWTTRDYSVHSELSSTSISFETSLIVVIVVVGCRGVVWTSYRDSNVQGGVPLSSVDGLSACLLACVENTTCTGVDYNINNTPGQRCFKHSSGSGQVNVRNFPGVNHYELTRNCEWFSLTRYKYHMNGSVI